MKKVFLAVLAIAAMMVSCQKEGLVDNQKETPEVEVNEPQPVILGSNLFKAPTTKASVDDMKSWKEDDNSIYVYALNNNDAAVYPAEEGQISKVFIDNVATSLKDNYDEGVMTGSLSLTDPDNDNKPFYYGTDNADIYDFYAYYLGYNLGEEVEPAATYGGDAITVADVNINGDNDIMIASTDRVADAKNDAGQMVNPTLLYSQYSARHGVTPNLVFKHQLSKFTFFVQYAGESECDIELTGITFNKVSKSGQITLSKDNQEFVAAEAQEGDNIEVILNEIGPLQKKEDESDGKYLNAGYIMVAPALNYHIIIDFKQTFGDQDEEFKNEEDLKTEKVKDNENNYLSAGQLFQAGNNYNVYITVYGLEEVKVDVTLTEWGEAGKIIIDRDAETDGIMKKVQASYADDNEETDEKPCTLYVEDFVPGKAIYCEFTDEGEDGKLVPAPAGTYTVTGPTEDPAVGKTIKVTEAGIIDSVEEPVQETPGV